MKKKKVMKRRQRKMKKLLSRLGFEFNRTVFLYVKNVVLSFLYVNLASLLYYHIFL